MTAGQSTPDGGERLAEARDPDTVADDLTALAAFPHWIVRMDTARNPHCPLATLHELANTDPQPFVREAALHTATHRRPAA